MPSVSWFYAKDRSSRSKALPPMPVIPEMDQRRYRYVIEGDNPPWRPVNAYDDGRGAQERTGYRRHGPVY
jgi:type IV secretory pathway VirB9-like protein